MYATFATCWYKLNSKFSEDTYLRWMKYMLEEVVNYNLVLFTDKEGEQTLRDHFAPYYFLNPRIKIVVKPKEQWHNYKYKKEWIRNHKINALLNGKTEWALNMLWAEKVHFVNDVRINQYFPSTDFYGWCDIGYFREGPCPSFCASHKMLALNKNKIYYAQVNQNEQEMQLYRELINRKNALGVPSQPLPSEQISIAGGFFIAHFSKIEGWATLFDTKLKLYFTHNYLVKDDQMIILDCIMTEPQRFQIINEAWLNNAEPNNVKQLNPWFQFRRFLSQVRGCRPRAKQAYNPTRLRLEGKPPTTKY